jgi:hypothetical protein
MSISAAWIFLFGREQTMHALDFWLKSQPAGLGTFVGAQQQLLDELAKDTDHAALYRMLADRVARFVQYYDGEPLDADVAERALERLRELVAIASTARGAPADERLKVLNDLARIDLRA